MPHTVKRESIQPRMTATESGAVGEVEGVDAGLDTAARQAEEEATACVSEVVEIMMQEVRTKMILIIGGPAQ